MRKIIEIPVGDLMSAPALTVTPETTIDEPHDSRRERRGRRKGGGGSSRGGT